MDPKIKELLEDIQSWMTDNDYECGDEGSLIWDRITEALVTEAQKKAE